MRNEQNPIERILNLVAWQKYVYIDVYTLMLGIFCNKLVVLPLIREW